MTHFHNILVPVDFEDSSQEALDVAIDLALTFDARLSVVHAWDVPSYAYTSLPYLSPDVGTAIEQAAKQCLEVTMARALQRMPRAEAVLVRGPPAAEILDAAGKMRADLIVMGTHGRRGVSRVFLGSVAEKVVRSSPVPVLTIRVKAQSAWEPVSHSPRPPS